MQLVGDMLDSMARAYPDKIAIIFDDTRLTYASLIEPNRLAHEIRYIGTDTQARAVIVDRSFLHLRFRCLLFITLTWMHGA